MALIDLSKSRWNSRVSATWRGFQDSAATRPRVRAPTPKIDLFALIVDLRMARHIFILGLSAAPYEPTEQKARGVMSLRDARNPSVLTQSRRCLVSRIAVNKVFLFYKVYVSWISGLYENFEIFYVRTHKKSNVDNFTFGCNS